MASKISKALMLGLFDGEDALQWDSWRTLGDMPAMEAMQLHCKTVEVDNPEWWDLPDIACHAI
jgi:hypothetical protein